MARRKTVKRYIKRKDGITQRYHISTKNLANYKKTKKKIKGRWAWKRKVPRKPPAKRVYRSTLTYVYGAKMEFRVWVHTQRPRITEEMLENKLDSLIRKIIPNREARNGIERVLEKEDAGFEVNREIPVDMVTDTMERWKGIAIFSKKGRKGRWRTTEYKEDL